jgi:hypothetical protein
MNDSLIFYPAKKAGMTLQVILAVVLTAGCGVLVFLAFREAGGGFLVLFLFGALVLFALLGLTVYRIYALQKASYTLERNGLRLRWGLRREDIPLTELEWVHPAEDLISPLRKPPFGIPGAYLGEVEHEDLGKVEYLASNLNTLVVIESFQNVFALSPEDPDEFIKAFNRVLEMGSLSPIEAYSSEPAEFIQQVLQDRYARLSLIVSLVLTLIMVVSATLLVPIRSTLSLGITAAGTPLDPVPSVGLLILPLLGSLAFVLNLAVGLYFYAMNLSGLWRMCYGPLRW